MSLGALCLRTGAGLQVRRAQPRGFIPPPWGHPQPRGRWQEVAGTGQAPTRASVGEVHRHRALGVPAGVPGVPPDLPAAYGALNGPQIASPCRIYGTADPITQRGTPWLSGGRGERGASRFQPCFTQHCPTNALHQPPVSPRHPRGTRSASCPIAGHQQSRPGPGQAIYSARMQPAGWEIKDFPPLLRLPPLLPSILLENCQSV